MMRGLINLSFVNLLSLFCIPQITAASSSFGLDGSNGRGIGNGSIVPLHKIKSAFQIHSSHRATDAKLLSPTRRSRDLYRYTNHPRNDSDRRFSGSLKLMPHHDNDENKCNDALQSAPQTRKDEQSTSQQIPRREILFHLMTLSTITLTQIPSIAQSSPEIDATGNLYSPKAEMLSRGGSAAARGIKLPKKERKPVGKDNLLSTGGLIQDVYETRFVAYLTRFLLAFDPAAMAWWKVNHETVYSCPIVVRSTQANNVTLCYSFS